MILDPTLPLVDSIDQLCFIDTETKAKPYTRGTLDESVVNSGAHRYARHSFVTIITYAIGEAPVQCLALPAFKRQDGSIMQFDFRQLPRDLQEFWIEAELGGSNAAYFAAWNMAFDRLALSNIPNAPRIRPEMTIDVMAQAVASNLPAKLDGAASVLKLGHKQEDGKDLIHLFANAEGPEPSEAVEKWERFKSYGVKDTDLLRQVYKATRPLPAREWEQYWVSERVNDRGQMVDVEFCKRAAALAAFNDQHIAANLVRLTNGQIRTVNQTKVIGEWLYDRLPSVEARDLLVKEYGDEDTTTDGDEDLVAVKLSVSSDRLEALMAWFEDRDEKVGLTDAEWTLMQIVEARLFGASATPKKFQKIVNQHVDDRLMGQYTFNGAQQTGRYSSRGVQVHNLMRASLGEREVELIELINDLEIAQ